jgi:hypothetical protein
MGGSIDVNPEIIDNRQYFSQTVELSFLNPLVDFKVQ